MSRITDIAKEMKTWWDEDDDTYVHRALDEIIRIDQEQATSIDIVRCKECKYASDNKVYGCMLELFNGNFERLYADDFCSYGERRE